MAGGEGLGQEGKVRILGVGDEVDYVGTDDRLDGIDDRLDGTDDGLDGTDDRLDGTNDRLNGTDEKLAGTDDKIGSEGFVQASDGNIGRFRKGNCVSSNWTCRDRLIRPEEGSRHL
ncbi:hypothetical protein U1Q18_001795 [Sarracenia purpurea var. burkii]